MAQMVVRGLDSKIVDRLKERARHHNRSLEAEVREILERAARADRISARRISQQLRRKLAGRRHTDSADLVAEDRAR